MRRPVPSVTVRAVRPVVAGLEALGHDVDGVLQRVGLARAALEDADARIPHATMMTLWRDALERSGDEDLGLHVAEAAPAESLGVHLYALRSSPTVREAYRRGCRYHRLIHDTTLLVFDEGEEEGVLRHALPSGRSVPRHSAEFLVALWIRFGRMLAGDAWAPAAVAFAHPEPPRLDEHARILRAPLRFASGRTAMRVPNARLDAPNRAADHGLLGVLDDYAERLLARAPSSATLTGRIRQLLVADAGRRPPTAGEVAEALHTSVRTLHRRLRDEGTGFRELLDQLRHERAVAYLDDPHLGVADVAFLLGFSELSSFYRAFRRWTGTTPAAFRADAQRPGGRASEGGEPRG